MKKIAIVTYHFYKTVTRGGEAHVLLLAEVLKKMADVTIVTTQSKNHLTWKNELNDCTDLIEGVKIVRHPVDFEIDPGRVTNLNHQLLADKNHSIKQEMSWMKRIGPFSNKLFEYLKKNKNDFDVFIFVGYANPITFFGLPIVKNKAFLIPLLHKEPRLYFKIFDKLFSQPKLILPSTQKEAGTMTKRFPDSAPMVILGINVPEPKKTVNINIKDRFELNKPYTLCIGRTEPYKGVDELAKYFNRFLKNNKRHSNLVFIGENIFPIKKNNTIKYLGVVSEEEKAALIKNCLFLINPSWYESLSLTILEAWRQKKPVLVNGECEVLKDQVIRSSGGLYYDNYQEFELKMDALINNRQQNKILGENGYKFYSRNYSKTVIEQKLETIINLID